MEGLREGNLEMTDSAWDELSKLAEIGKRNKSLSQKEMELIILSLCQKNWLTKRQLGELLGRNPEGLRERFLAPMVENGLLRLRYPGKSNQPDQAYTKNY